MKPVKTDSITAWFGALCFFLSTIEYMIPKPLPFLRLGLANLPILFSIDIIPFPAYCGLVLIKILGQGLIGGTLFSYVFLFSAAGSVASAVIMLALKKAFRDHISWIGVSAAGAFASNAAQLTLARFYIFGKSAWLIAPPFLVVGAISGAALGVFANAFAKNSEWYADVRKGKIAPHQTPTVNTTNPRWTFRVIPGLALILTFMFCDNLAILTGILALAIILLFVDSSPIRPISAFVMTVSIIFFNLLAPFGKILWNPLGFPLTEGALLLGIKKALTVEGMIFVSRWMLKPGIQLPGKAGALISQSFEILGSLSSRKKKIDPKNIVQSIDAIMYGRD